jgi:competence protein ComFC
MISKLGELFFPNNCRICQTKLESPLNASGKICSTCWSKLEYIMPPYCRRCGHPAGDGPTSACDHCQNLTPAFAFARAIGRYNGVLREAIHQFKFQYREDLAEPLAKIMVHYLSKSRDFADLNAYDYLIPVPLHKTKFRDREFNQVEMLANYIAQQVAVPVISDNLYRKRYTTPQMTIPADERHQNVENAFAVRNPAGFNQKRVLLLDDIMTTGATVNECSRVLMHAGCTMVTVLVLARG